MQLNSLHKVLRERDLTNKVWKLEEDLYFNQTAAKGVESVLSGSFPIEIDVYQGGIFSMDCFSLLSRMITRRREEKKAFKEMVLISLTSKMQLTQFFLQRTEKKKTFDFYE